MVQAAFFLASFLLALGDPPVDDLQDKETGDLMGIVQDSAGSRVPEVKLKLIQQAGQQSVELTSDDTGRFEFTNQPVGNYTLSVTATGFKPAGLAVTIGPSAAPPVQVRLEILDASERVTISAQAPSVSAELNADMVELDEHLMLDLPATNGDPLTVAFLFTDPAVAGAGGPQVLVDGVPTDALDVPISSIRHLAVNKNPYSAEFGRPGKGRIEVETRRRFHHQYHGTVFSDFQNSIMDARNAFATERPLHQRDISEAELDGPVSRRLTFLLSGRYDLNNNAAVIDAQTPPGPLSENVVAPERTTNLLSRINFGINANHKLGVAYRFKNRSRRNLGVGGFNLPERATNNFDHWNELRIFETSTPKSALLNDFRFTLRQRRNDADSASDRRAIIVTDAFRAGGSQTSLHQRETFVDIEDIAAFTRGIHTFRLGGGARPKWLRAMDSSNFGGTFTFPSLAAFSQNSPILFSGNVGNPEVSFSQHEFYAFLQDEMRLRQNVFLTFGLRYEWQSNGNSFDNLAPRLAFAYAPGSGHTVVRAGFGIFYDRQPEIMKQQSLLYDGVRIRQFVISDPSYPNPIPSSPTSDSLPASIVRIAPGILFPYLLQGNLAVERKLGKADNYVSADFTTVRGVHLYRMRDVNAPLPGNTSLPNPDFRNIDQFESTGTSRGNSLTLTLRMQPQKNLHLIAQYVLSRTMDDTAGFFSLPATYYELRLLLPANNYDLREEWGRADHDRRHRFNLMGTYSLPSGFRMGGVAKIASGPPFNITTGFDDYHDGVANARPPGVTRNTGRGPGYADVDLRLSKVLKLEALKTFQVEFGVDAFNILNHVNFKNYVGTLTSPFFGRANTADAARQMQLSIRLSF
jgi:hypothetical protein